ncbi:MAG: type II toxin-antitoxin system ParD family antitoxin [Pseudomonadota bacterium]
MSVKSSISLSKQQDSYARDLVASGRYASLSAVLQHGLELLRDSEEAERMEQDALRLLLAERAAGPAVTAGEMDARVAAMLDDKRRALGLEG